MAPHIDDRRLRVLPHDATPHAHVQRQHLLEDTIRKPASLSAVVKRHWSDTAAPSSGSEDTVQLTTATVSIMVAMASQIPRVTAMLAGSLDCRRSFGEDAERGRRRRRSAPGADGTTSSSALPMAQHSCGRPASCAAVGAVVPAVSARRRCWWEPGAAAVLTR